MTKIAGSGSALVRADPDPDPPQNVMHPQHWLVWLAVWMIGLLASWLVGWLCDWLLGWRAGFWFEWLVVGLLSGWVVDELAGGLVDWLADWLLTDWLIDWLADWLVGYLAGRLLDGSFLTDWSCVFNLSLLVVWCFIFKTGLDGLLKVLPQDKSPNINVGNCISF